MSSSADISSLITAATHLIAAKYYDLAAFVMLLYDTLLTVPREVEKIWKQKWTVITLLWFLNRWIFILAVIPTIIAFHLPAFMGEVTVCITYFFNVAVNLRCTSSCERWFRYPGIIATYQRVVIGSVFILRTYCIYGRNIAVAALIAAFLTAEVTLKLYADFKWGAPVDLPKGFIACVLSVAPENALKFSMFWISELCTDTVILVITLYRSYVVSRTSSVFKSSGLWHVIVKDGAMYFFVMFAANLTTVIFDLTASQDLKAINANFGVMINCIMTSRLILNLKSATSRGEATRVRYEGFDGPRNALETRLFGDIGNMLEDGSFSSSARSGTTLASRSDAGVRKPFQSGYGCDYELAERRRDLFS